MVENITQTSFSVSSKASRTSKACDRCRLRKIKCDGILTGCSKCLTKQISCIYSDRSNNIQPNLSSRLKFFTPEIENTEVTKRKFSYACKVTSYPLYKTISDQAYPVADLHAKFNQMNESKQIKIVPYSHAQSHKFYTKSRSMSESLNHLDQSLIRFASKTAHSQLHKHVLLAMYPNGKFEVQGFSPIGYMFTNASFVEYLSDSHFSAQIFNAKSATFFPIPQPHMMAHTSSNGSLPNMNWPLVTKILSMEYFKRIHFTYPIIDPYYFLQLLDEYNSGNFDIHRGSWPLFRFLVNVLSLVTIPMAPELSQFHEFFETEVKSSIKKYFRTPHIFICQALFLLRTFPKLKDKNSKWVRLNDIAIRMSIALGGTKQYPDPNRDESLRISRLRLGVVAQIIDLAVISAINTQPQLTDDIFSNPFFDLPLSHSSFQAPCCTSPIYSITTCKFNTNEYFPQCRHHDFISLRFILEGMRIYYRANQFNNNIIIYDMDKFDYIKFKLLDGISIENSLQSLLVNIPTNFNTLIEFCPLQKIAYDVQLADIDPQLAVMQLAIPTLPLRSQKFTIYIQLWCYFNIISIYEKMSNFSLIWIHSFDSNCQLSPSGSIRKYSAHRCLLASYCITQLCWLLGDHFGQYMVNNKYLIISKTALTLSRSLIAYNNYVDEMSANRTPVVIRAKIQSIQLIQSQTNEFPFTTKVHYFKFQEPTTTRFHSIHEVQKNLEFIASLLYFDSKEIPLARECYLTLNQYLKQHQILIQF